jgi:hypothetical protein
MSFMQIFYNAAEEVLPVDEQLGSRVSNIILAEYRILRTHRPHLADGDNAKVRLKRASWAPLPPVTTLVAG